MADISDVSTSLVAIIAGALYPNGTSQPSVVGAPVAVYPGWPTASQLDADLAGFSNGQGGRLHVTVFPTPTEKSEPAYRMDWQALTINAATLTATISGQTVTLSGTVSTPQNVALLVDNAGYVYPVQPADTLTTIATALAALVPGATSSGAVITVPNGAKLTAARTGGSGTMQRELRRQMRVMQITAWADTPANRDALAQAVDAALSAIPRFVLADQTQARLLYQSGRQIDDQSKANLYRRDLMYSVEYSTTQTTGATDVVIGVETFAAGVTGVDTYPVSSTLVQ
ncbi:MAG: hypothetical protein KGL35_08385 [Bradyrhizobium sp.]|nr:hypothetical protein [Bradyrhizobium sp.]